jgi:hypothetical protein
MKLSLAAASLLAHAHDGGGGGLSTPAVLALVIGGVLVLLSLAWGLARAYAWEPRWSRSLRHSVAEAGFRTAATWHEFTDWARLGR